MLPTRSRVPDKRSAPASSATGHGNYGHDHDLIFNGRENVAVVPSPISMPLAAPRP
jgi:hypothetical protein